MEADEESYYQSDSPVRGRKVVISGGSNMANTNDGRSAGGFS
jgi:hypothetical protein